VQDSPPLPRRLYAVILHGAAGQAITVMPPWPTMVIWRCQSVGLEHWKVPQNEGGFGTTVSFTARRASILAWKADANNFWSRKQLGQDRLYYGITPARGACRGGTIGHEGAPMVNAQSLDVISVLPESGYAAVFLDLLLPRFRRPRPADNCEIAVCYSDSAAHQGSGRVKAIDPQQYVRLGISCARPSAFVGRCVGFEA